MVSEACVQGQSTCKYSTLLNISPCRRCPRPSSDSAETRDGEHFRVEYTFITRTSHLILHYRSNVSIHFESITKGYIKGRNKMGGGREPKRFEAVPHQQPTPFKKNNGLAYLTLGTSVRGMDVTPYSQVNFIGTAASVHLPQVRSDTQALAYACMMKP